MRSFGPFFGVMGMGIIVAATSSLSGCSDAPGTTPPAGLSTAYSSNCSRCHGPKGEGAGQFPKIPGTKTDEASYIAAVRGGSADRRMPAFSASQISDADLKADFVFLTTKR